MTFGEQLLTLFVWIAVPMTFIGVPFFVFTGGIQKFARRPLDRCYQGLQIHETPQPGDVYVIYHTYRGFLVWVTQDEHRIVAPPQDAKVILARFLRFNLTWGLLSYCLAFVPLLAIANYYAQKKSIAQQESALAAKHSEDQGN